MGSYGSVIERFKGFEVSQNISIGRAAPEVDEGAVMQEREAGAKQAIVRDRAQLEKYFAYFCKGKHGFSSVQKFLNCDKAPSGDDTLMSPIVRVEGMISSVLFARDEGSPEYQIRFLLNKKIPLEIARKVAVNYFLALSDPQSPLKGAYEKYQLQVAVEDIESLKDRVVNLSDESIPLFLVEKKALESVFSGKTKLSVEVQDGYVIDGETPTQKKERLRKLKEREQTNMAAKLELLRAFFKNSPLPETFYGALKSMDPMEAAGVLELTLLLARDEEIRPRVNRIKKVVTAEFRDLENRDGVRVADMLTSYEKSF